MNSATNVCYSANAEATVAPLTFYCTIGYCSVHFDLQFALLQSIRIRRAVVTTERFPMIYFATNDIVGKLQKLLRKI